METSTGFIVSNNTKKQLWPCALHFLSLRTWCTRCWMFWLQRKSGFWQRVKMSWTVEESSSAFSHHHHHLATFASLSVQDTSTSYWMSGSRSTGTTGRNVCALLLWNKITVTWLMLTFLLGFAVLDNCNFIKTLSDSVVFSDPFPHLEQDWYV